MSTQIEFNLTDYIELVSQRSSTEQKKRLAKFSQMLSNARAGIPDNSTKRDWMELAKFQDNQLFSVRTLLVQIRAIVFEGHTQLFSRIEGAIFGLDNQFPDPFKDSGSKKRRTKKGMVSKT